MFSHIPGNEAIKKYLSRAIDTGTTGNSLLFAGPKGIGKGLFAEAFAKAVISGSKNQERHQKKLDSGNHPDLHFYKPEGKIGMHSILAMRQLSEEVYLPPYEAERKVFIIYDADRMLPYSSNALLKTFEEPSLDTMIILLSSSPELLLPTILSRCRKVNFSPLSKKDSLLSGDEDHSLTLNMLDVLARGKFESYAELVSKAKELAEIIDTKCKELEVGMRALYIQGHNEKLTSAQRDSLEKELDGAMAMESSREANQLFDTILTWQRDLLLLSVNGDPELLFHRNHYEVLKSSLAGSQMLPLTKVFTTIQAAKLALARSTALNICLETLFLKLF